MRAAWTEDEVSTLRSMALAGKTSAAIAKALPGRTYVSVKSKRPKVMLTIGNNRRGAFIPRAAATKRIVWLERIIEREMQERRPDWELIDEYIGGLQWLRAQ